MTSLSETKVVQRGDVDDASVATLQHVLAEDLAGAQRAGDIGVHDVVPGLLGDRQRGLALDLSGAVDENVDLAELLQGSGEQCLERSAVADVGGEAQSAAAFGLDRLRGLFHLLGAA